MKLQDLKVNQVIAGNHSILAVRSKDEYKCRLDEKRNYEVVTLNASSVRVKDMQSSVLYRLPYASNFTNNIEILTTISDEKSRIDVHISSLNEGDTFESQESLKYVRGTYEYVSYTNANSENTFVVEKKNEKSLIAKCLSNNNMIKLIFNSSSKPAFKDVIVKKVITNSSTETTKTVETVSENISEKISFIDANGTEIEIGDTVSNIRFNFNVIMDEESIKIIKNSNSQIHYTLVEKAKKVEKVSENIHNNVIEKEASLEEENNSAPVENDILNDIAEAFSIGDHIKDDLGRISYVDNFMILTLRNLNNWKNFTKATSDEVELWKNSTPLFNFTPPTSVELTVQNIDKALVNNKIDEIAACIKALYTVPQSLNKPVIDEAINLINGLKDVIDPKKN